MSSLGLLEAKIFPKQRAIVYYCHGCYIGCYRNDLVVGGGAIVVGGGAIVVGGGIFFVGGRGEMGGGCLNW